MTEITDTTAMYTQMSHIEESNGAMPAIHTPLLDEMVRLGYLEEKNNRWRITETGWEWWYENTPCPPEEPAEPELSTAALIADLLSSPIVKPVPEKPHRSIWLQVDRTLVIWRGNTRRGYDTNSCYDISQSSLKRLHRVLQQFEMVVNLHEDLTSTIHFYAR